MFCSDQLQKHFGPKWWDAVKDNYLGSDGQLYVLYSAITYQGHLALYIAYSSSLLILSFCFQSWYHPKRQTKTKTLPCVCSPCSCL